MIRTEADLQRATAVEKRIQIAEHSGEPIRGPVQPWELEENLPNYFGSHDAMARARATLRPAQMRAYGMLLHQLLSDKIRQDGKVRWIFDATPEEQAEAFLRVFLCDEMPEYSRRLESKQEGGGIDT